jgi:cell wall-associated NlpC family hydrolase
MSPPIRTAAGSALIELAKTRCGEEYLLGALVPKDDASWHGPWDCAEFVAWVLFQKSGALFGCFGEDPKTADAYSGFFADQALRQGRRVPVDTGIRSAGCALVRVAKAGTIGHVALAVGDGSTVEAHSRNRGVIVALDAASRRWDMGIYLPGVQYTRNTEAITPPTVPTVYRLQRPWMTGDAVKAVQGALKAKGYAVGLSDAVYGPRTHAAVRDFQALFGLIIDGEFIIGGETWAALGLH